MAGLESGRLHVACTMGRGGRTVTADHGKTRLGPMMTREVAIVVVVMMVRTLIA